MKDDLLERADRALRDNQIIREQCVRNLMQARAASACIKRTLKWARADTAMAHQLGLETADRVAAALENREANAVSGSSEKT
jgi:hypothetical protein